MIYLAIAVILIGGLIYFFAKGKREPNASENLISNAQQNGTNQRVEDNPYAGLRDMALSVTADQLQLVLSNDRTEIYGVIMDWDVGGGIATLTSFATGDASMYMSSGGGTIGGGHHANVANAAKSFVDKAQGFLNYAKEVAVTPLPDKDCVRFYLLTNKGTFSAQERLQNFDNSSSVWLPLFEEGNEVISELRGIRE